MKAKLKEKNLEAHRLPPTRKSDVWDGPYAPPPCYCPLIYACIEFAFGQGRVRFKYYTSESRDNPTLLATCEQKSRSSVGLTISRLIGSFYLALIWYNEPSQYLFLAC